MKKLAKLWKSFLLEREGDILRYWHLYTVSSSGFFSLPLMRSQSLSLLTTTSRYIWTGPRKTGKQANKAKFRRWNCKNHCLMINNSTIYCTMNVQICYLVSFILWLGIQVFFDYCQVKCNLPFSQGDSVLYSTNTQLDYSKFAWWLWT